MRACNTLTFRFATAADVAAVVDLVHAAYRGEPSRAGWTTEADLLDGGRTDAAEIAAAVADLRSRIILAEHDGVPIACVCVRAASGRAEIGLFAVRPTMQARGIGRALLAKAEDVARRDLGARTARMHVLVQRPALIAWYARRGYRATSERRAFPDDPRFGIPRRPDLVFAVLEKDLTAD